MSWAGAWPSLPIQHLKASLSSVEVLVDSPAHGQSDDVSRALSRFLVVRTSGYLEQVVAECCRAYLESKAAPRVASFGSSFLTQGLNPSPGNLLKVAERFSQVLKDDLETLLCADDEKLKREISFLVDRRNKIDHGESEGITARKALDLVGPATTVADWFVDNLDPR